MKTQFLLLAKFKKLGLCMTVILFALETLWVFGFVYMETTFLTLLIYLIIFIVKFNYEMFKLRKD